jgi:hypothetical protein
MGQAQNNVSICDVFMSTQYTVSAPSTPANHCAGLPTKSVKRKFHGSSASTASTDFAAGKSRNTRRSDVTGSSPLALAIKVKKGLFPWTALGRAIANGRDEGVTKLLFDDLPEAHGHGKILGGGMVGTHAGDMIGEVALAIEMGADAIDIGKTIHPHPTLGESIGMAAEVAHGSCTDVPPARK